MQKGDPRPGTRPRLKGAPLYQYSAKFRQAELVTLVKAGMLEEYGAGEYRTQPAAKALLARYPYRVVEYRYTWRAHNRVSVDDCWRYVDPVEFREMAERINASPLNRQMFYSRIRIYGLEEVTKWIQE